MGRLDLRTEFLFECEATISRVDAIGATPFGRRRVYWVSGGTFLGPRIRGDILPWGADWIVRGSDGTSEIDVRATLRTHDEALIYYYYRGIYYSSSAATSTSHQASLVEPSEFYFRITPRFETGSKKYGWLNRVVAVGVGEAEENRVAYRVYGVL